MKRGNETDHEYSRKGATKNLFSLPVETYIYEQ